MNLKHGFDDEFRPKVHKSGSPVRSIGLLLIGLATCGTAVTVMGGVGKRNEQRRFPVPQTQRPVKIRQIKGPLVQPRDAFMVVAPADIDPKMVVAAPPGIDEAMVFNPESRDQTVAPSGTAPGRLLVPLPVVPPGGAPVRRCASRVTPAGATPLNPKQYPPCPSPKTWLNAASAR